MGRCIPSPLFIHNLQLFWFQIVLTFTIVWVHFCDGDLVERWLGGVGCSVGRDDCLAERAVGGGATHLGEGRRGLAVHLTHW